MTDGPSQWIDGKKYAQNHTSEQTLGMSGKHVIGKRKKLLM